MKEIDKVEEELNKLLVKEKDIKWLHKIIEHRKNKYNHDYLSWRIERYDRFDDLNKRKSTPEEFIDWCIRYLLNLCPSCGSNNTEVENHDLMWHDGDIICQDCRTFVRYFDAG